MLPWWLGTKAGSIDDHRRRSSQSAGRVTGLIGGYLLLVQLLMMSRVRWLEAGSAPATCCAGTATWARSLVVAVLAARSADHVSATR